MAVDKEQFYRELDRMPEHQIRAMIAQGNWGDDKRKVAELYLTEKEAERQKVLNAKALSIARNGTDAAWASARAAEGANRHARFAIGVSVVSAFIAAGGLVVAIVALLK